MTIAVARAVIRDLSALSDEQMRRRKLFDWLVGEEPLQKRGLWGCEEILSQAAAGSPTGRSLLGCALHALLALASSQQVCLLAISREERLPLARSTLLASLMPTQRMSGGGENHFIDDRGRTLSLGERRALARRPSSQHIEKLLFDPDPIVLGHLLQNPRLTEALLMKVVTHRPQHPRVLFDVFDHPKWGSRVDIKRALGMNPSTPLPLRCALVSYLNREDCDLIRRETQRSALLLAALNRIETHE